LTLAARHCARSSQTKEDLKTAGLHNVISAPELEGFELKKVVRDHLEPSTQPSTVASRAPEEVDQVHVYP
jgi:hypothetical protein